VRSKRAGCPWRLPNAPVPPPGVHYPRVPPRSVAGSAVRTGRQSKPKWTTTTVVRTALRMAMRMATRKATRRAVKAAARMPTRTAARAATRMAGTLLDLVPFGTATRTPKFFEGQTHKQGSLLTNVLTTFTET
jgi:hypothetical protein